MRWGAGPWGGAVHYRVEMDGTMRDVADVAEQALKAWGVAAHLNRLAPRVKAGTAVASFRRGTNTNQTHRRND
jgi:hypothetical protein